MKLTKRICSLLLAAILILMLFPESGAKAASTEELVKEKISWIIASIPDSCDTDYEKVRYLHDYLCDTVTYKRGESDGAETALLNGIADCGGYAAAYKELLNAVGIRCEIIIGTAQGDSHGWNIVWLDAKCYYTDVTWDDTSFGIVYKYFMISEEEMSRNHTALTTMDPAGFPESCNHTDRHYVYKDTGKPGSGHFNNATTAAEAAQRFKVYKVENSRVYYSCNFQFDGDPYDWAMANLTPIGQALGKEVYVKTLDTGNGWGSLTYEGFLVPYTPGESLAFTESVVQLNDSNMRKQLSVKFTPANTSFQAVRYTSSDPRIAKVNDDGLVQAVSSGTATITATAVDGKTTTCQVVVNHTHKAIRAVSASTANCLNKGYKAHYICDSCGTRFSDSKGKNVVSLMDVVTPTTRCMTQVGKHDDENHWVVCICGSLIIEKLPHRDYDGDGVCDGMRCGYVMNPSATKPTTQPNQQTTKPGTTTTTKPGTSQNQPTGTMSTEPGISTTDPETDPSSQPDAEPATPPTEGTSETEQNTVPSASETVDVQETEKSSSFWWVWLGLLGVAAVIAIVLIVRKRK